MKKQPLSILVILTCIFVTFTIGFFIGRNFNHDTILVSTLSTEPRHDAPLETISLPVSPTEQILFPIDVNTASVEELSALPGIGEELARRIMMFREQNGPFSKPEELLNVTGIGPGKLENILDYVITGG